MFSRNGYWVRINLNNKIVSLIKIENELDEYGYRNGKWVKRDKFTMELGASDEWEKIPNDKIDEIIKNINW